MQPTTAMPSLEPVREYIGQHWGFDTFRPLQEEAVQSVLAGKDSVVVLPTGGGKSLCFQAPAGCMEGLAVVVSPLISLMKDQVDALQANGIAAAFFNSSLMPHERNDVIEAVRTDALKLLYLAPEGLLTGNMQALLSGVPISFFAIDEAHCISSWGHDFRPEYRGLQLLKQRFPGVAVHAYTATATERVRADIATQLALVQPTMLVGSFDRPNLVYRVARRERGLGQIVDIVKRHANESGIIYCISRKKVEETSAALNSLGYQSAPYHAGLSPEERIRNQEAFLEERIDIIVATVAFGMGIDKSNVRFVAHAGMPKSLEAYQQESGRAGRDGLEAECCLLYGGGDFGTWKRLMDMSGDASEAAMDALSRIDRFCKSIVCRHRSLVEHFGQAFTGDNCKACDICLDEVEQLEEPLIIAQKILSCVARLDQSFGADYTAQVLAGSEDQRILGRGHDKLSTHGILGEYSKQIIRDWLEQLVGQGCACKATEYNLVQLTEQGWQVLRGEYTPKLLKPATKQQKQSRSSRKSEDPSSWEGVDRELFEELRTLRRDLASEKAVPAYIVFGDASLRDMARRRPSTPDGFLKVHGVGEKKASEYAEAFLQCLNEHCSANAVAMDMAASTISKPTQSAYKKQATLTASAIIAFPHFAAGKSVPEVAEAMGRAESTVTGYLDQFLRQEGTTDPSPWVDEPTAARVRSAIDVVGNEKLRPIFDYLEEEVSYDVIRIVANCLANAMEG